MGGWRERLQTTDVEPEIPVKESPSARKNSLAPWLEGLFLASTLQDWAQTSKFLRDPEHFEEGNPLLGKHPSQAKMTGFGVLADAAQYAGYKALPDDYKTPFALLSALASISNVRHNKRIIGYPINKPAALAGAALTGYLVNDWKKKHNDNNISIGVDQVGSTMIPVISKKW